MQRGVLMCGSAWECHVCAHKRRLAAVAEIERAVNEWRSLDGHCYMLSLTFAHRMGDDLGTLRRGLANAWRRVARGAPWERLKERAGYAGSCRAAEVTFGENGWHPHLHVLIFAERDLTGSVRKLENDIHERWEAAVVAELGARHAPSRTHGTRLTIAHRETYVSKLGLEMSGALTKEAGNGHVAAWKLPDMDAHPWPTRRTPRELWHEYCRDMRGARVITWTRRLRETLGVNDVDEEPARQWLGVLPGRAWDRLARERAGLLLAFLDSANQRGWLDACDAFLTPEEARYSLALCEATIQHATGPPVVPGIDFGEHWPDFPMQPHEWEPPSVVV